MKKLYNRYQLQFTNYFESIELLIIVILIVTFGIKGPIDLFTKGHYYLINYIRISIISIIGVALSFIDVLIVDCINAKRKAKKDKMKR